MMSDFDSMQLRAPDGRGVALWCNRPKEFSDSSPIAIIMPGFGKRMHQHSALTQHLLANNIAVIRFDFLNHTGLSDGNVINFTLGDGMISLNTALDFVDNNFNVSYATLISTSLSARLAIRKFSTTEWINQLIAISGVVNVQNTLSCVLPYDYTAYDESELPETVYIEGQTIATRPFYHDIHTSGWVSAIETAKEFEASTRPISWFVGSSDAWVAIDEVRSCASSNRLGTVRVVELRNCGHDVSRNAAIARELMRQIVRLCRAPTDDSDAPVIEARHEQILQAALEERRCQREGRAAS